MWKTDRNTGDSGNVPPENLHAASLNALQPLEWGRMYRALVVGASAGGMQALGRFVSMLPDQFPGIVVIVQHLYPQSDSSISRYLGGKCRLKVKEAQEKERAVPGMVYTVTPNYHLLVERDHTFALSVDDKVNYSRPSIDVLFESAARVWRKQLVGVLLTGANQDGTCGLKLIKRYGGLTIAQNPLTAEFPAMPKAAVDAGVVDFVMTLEEMGERLFSRTE